MVASAQNPLDILPRRWRSCQLVADLL